MNRRITFFPMLALLLLAVAPLQGCGQPTESRHAGTYELDKSLMLAEMEAGIAAIEDPAERQAMEMGMAMIGAGMLDMLHMTITLNPDGTASSTSTMMGQSETVLGKWSARGDAVTIEMSDEGQSEAVDGRITGDTLELFPPEGEEVPFRMVLTRQYQ